MVPRTGCMPNRRARTNVVGSDRNALSSRDLILILRRCSSHIDLGKCPGEAAERQETTHNTLIVTEQEEVETRNETDCEVQLRPS